MLQRAKFWKLEKDMKEKGINIYELCRETNRFVTFVNSIDLTDDFIEKIEYVRKAETSLKTVINILFSEMNPDLNPLISIDEGKNSNYNSLLLRLDRLNSAIAEARQNLTVSLKSKVDIETNVLINNTNIALFISNLSSIFNDLIFHSIKKASEIILSHVRKDTELAIDFGDKVIHAEKEEILFYYLAYAYFLRTLQSSVPIFSSLKPSESQIKILPPEAKEYMKMTSKPQQNLPEEKIERKKSEGGEHGNTEESEE